MIDPLRREIEELGFRHMHYKMLRPLDVGSPPLNVVSSFPDDWINRYVD
jgi:hypothetical protein